MSVVGCLVWAGKVAKVGQGQLSKPQVPFLGFQEHGKLCACKCPEVVWKSIQCGSRFLTETESRYAPIEFEALCVAWACHYFLAGLPEFLIRNDHRQKIISHHGSGYDIQGWAKVRFPGSVNMRWKHCVVLPAAGRRTQLFHLIFSEPGVCGFADPCRSRNR